MSISSISAVGNTYPIMESSQTNSAQSTFALFEQLASDLQSNNLSGAQQAYSTLSSMMPAASSSQTNSPFATAFQALGQALQSGNLQAAQQAFSNLQQDAIQGMGGHHHHHHGGGGGQVQSSTSSNNVPDSLFNNPSSSSSNSNSNSSSSNSQNTDQLDLLNLLA
jgi:hypothetical protein